MSVFGFDLGNRFPKFGYGDHMKKLASYRAVIPAFQEVSPHQLSAQSHLVEIGAIRTVVGADAVSYGARPTFQGADGHKWVHAKVFLFAALAELGLFGDVHIELLRTVTPDTQQPDQVTALKALEGAHSATVDGQEIRLVVSQVAVHDEGQPAWLVATNEQKWHYPAAMNGVLDLGGGTGIARLFSPTGAPMRQSQLILSGTFALAEKIQSYMAGPRCIPEIMDAIENGSFQVPSGREFKSIFDHCLPEWLADIRGEIRSRWSAFEGRYGQIVVVGGSAPLANTLIEENPRYLSLEDPQTVSLRGLLING
ncbi:hypothetical protein N836_00300 [Leptolyngbya sp. Heron Island J]|uniref:ParM/StbA family protein n=1 Tax=Leptolyngbya sp. Heron Island J TaxID=1385935 RepID=UPI0003B99BE4|nr:hypothetical protein [Leptolyngbya sp. Heron Island J]ESA37153.1 hypothetical protein N836_00300 [Leptolyngbya sp. Heron Island J]